MTFVRTYNYELARTIMTHSARIYRAISDDCSPSIEHFKPFEHESLWYVLVISDGGELLGLFLFVPQNAICFSVHTCLLPKAWGPLAKQAGRGVAEWMWENSICHRIVTEVPENNKLALQYAQDCGMTIYGRNPQSILKGGKLMSQVLLGISRPARFTFSKSAALSSPDSSEMVPSEA